MRPAALFLLLSPFFAHGNAPAGEANPVDDYFSGYWKEEKIRPALPANDYEFLRRLTLDLSGRLPTPGEIRSFVRNRSPEKRALKIEELLVEESTAQFWADQWLRILFQYRFAETDPVKVHFPSFVGWLKNAFRSDMPYDRFLTHLVADRGDYKKKPATNYILKHLDPKEPPVELTSRMTRVFLGYQIQCAQCHDHPTAEWSQESFWGLTAFFSGLQSKPRATFEGVSVKLFDKGAGEITIPDTETRVAPRFLDGREPANPKKAGEELARFFLEYGDDQFSRALVNRIWAHFMGRGFVEPLDRFGSDSRPSHPELLNRLTRHFVKNGHSIHTLFRAILHSKAYQLGCETKRDVADTSHARMLLKPQNPVQFLNTLSYTLQLDVFLKEVYEKEFLANPDLPETYRNEEVFRMFLHLFTQGLLAPGGRAPEESDYAGSVRLALRLMNNQDLQGTMSVHYGQLKEIMKYRKPADRLEEIFLTILSRPPSRAEQARYLRYIVKKKGSPRAYEDIYWTLLNSTEFIFNH